MKPPPPDLDQDLDNYLTHLAAERGLAANTLEAYADDLRDAGDYLRKQGLASWRRAEQIHILGYLADASRRGLAPRSRARQNRTTPAMIAASARRLKNAKKLISSQWGSLFQ